MPKRRKRRAVSRLRHKRAKSFNFASGLIYSGAVIVAITLGGLFYRGFQNAKKTSAEQTSPVDQESPIMPPGSIVITRSGKRRETPRKIEPLRNANRVTSRRSKPPPISTPDAMEKSTTEDLKSEPESIAFADMEQNTEPMPSITPLPVIPWGSEPMDTSLLQEKKIMANADTCIMVNPRASRELNGGALEEISLHGNDSFMLSHYDIDPIRGWTINKAIWIGKIKQGKVHTLGFSTIPVPWKEGTGTLQEKTTGGATYKWADYKRIPWREDEAPITYLTRGNNHSLFFAASPLEEQMGFDVWVKVEMNPVIVQSLVAGASHGIVITDEKGQLGKSISIASRADADSAYFIEVEGAKVDVTPPGTIPDLKAYGHPSLRHPASVGVVLTWTATGDDEDNGQAFMYDIRYAPSPASFDRAMALPRDQCPVPQPAGKPDKVIIEGLEPDTIYAFFIRAVDESGQAGPSTEVTIRTPSALPLPTTRTPDYFQADSIDIAARSLGLRVIDELAGVDPVSAKISGEPRTRNTQSVIWDRDTRALRLRAAQNETLGFFLILDRKGTGFPSLRINSTPLKNAKNELKESRFRFYRTWYSRANSQRWLGDALIPITGKLSLSSLPNKIPNQLSQSIYTEFHVPAEAEPGTYLGKIDFTRNDGTKSSINVLLKVLPLRIPDRPQFTIELLVPPTLSMLYRKDPANTEDAQPVENSYYGLAHNHRANLVIQPYLRNGGYTQPFTPPTEETGLDLTIKSWTDWDKRMGPYLSGSAFNGSPLANTSIPYFILPTFENWPTAFEDGFSCTDKTALENNEKYPVFTGQTDEIHACLTTDYWRALRVAVRQFRDHLRAKNWTDVGVHFWLNNNPTTTYKGRAPVWFLGDPIYRDDFIALENYAEIVRTDQSSWPENKLITRVTVTNVVVLGNYGKDTFSLLCVKDTDPYAWETLRHHIAHGQQVWVKSEVLPMENNSVSIEETALAYFLSGADGWSIANVTGRRESWAHAQPQSLFYCGLPLNLEYAFPSIRLKALRRLEQDLEYLLLLQKKMGWTREQLADFVYEIIPMLANGQNRLSTKDLNNLRFVVQELLMQ